MVVGIATGHSEGYLLNSVAAGKESYYLDATVAGEAPGQWKGKGAEALGLRGEVDPEVMKAVYSGRLDPRDPRFQDPETRDQSDRLGNAPRAFKTAHELTVERLTKSGQISAERVEVLRAEARSVAATPGLAERRLEVLLGGDQAMTPEDVRAVRAGAEQSERQNVAFIDVTYSPPKSVTAARVAFERAELDAQRAAARYEAGSPERAYHEAEAAKFAGLRHGVVNAIIAGADESLRVMEDKAGYSRVGRHGAGADRWIDTEGLTAAQFYQTTSRELDPQDHVHQAILNKVVCSDGEVRTLDSKAIHDWKQAAGTAGERKTFEMLADMGLESAKRPDGNCRELVGVDPTVRDTFSERSRQMAPRVRELVEAYEAKYQRPVPNYVLTQMKQDASLATRKAKGHEPETKEQMLDRWEDKARSGLGTTLNKLANDLADSRHQVQAQGFSATAVKAKALAAVQEGRAAWSRSELYRQVELALPDRLGTERAHVIVDKLTDEIIAEVEQITGATPAATVPAEQRLADGRSRYARPGGPRYASEEHLRIETRMVEAAQVRGRLRVEAGAVRAWIAEKADWMTESQKAALVGIMSDGAALKTLVGPAGTGKSTVCGALSKCWTDLTGGRVIGVAKSQIATEVLTEDGVRSVNLDTWLGMQERATNRRAGGEDLKYAVQPTDLIVVDESSMAETVAVDRVREYVERVGGEMMLAGDPAQLSSVDAGGVMSMLVNGAAPTYQLTEVMRFKNADGSIRQWAAKASLDVRDGKEEGLYEYYRRGALQDAGTRENAERMVARGYLADTSAGLKSLAILPTNEQAGRVSGRIRDELVKLGKVDPAGVPLGLDGNVAGVGDLVRARENNYAVGVTNQRRYEVREVLPDGGLRVVREDNGREVTMPAAYVQEHVQLGYAGTVHSGQGLTVDTCHGAHEGQGDVAGLYVPLSRGVQANTLYVVTQPEVPGESTGQTHERERRSVMSVLGGALESDRQDQMTALAQRAEDARQAGSMRTVHAWYEAGVQDICRSRLDRWLDDMASAGAISESERAQLGNDQATESVSRLLRAVEQAGHDPELALYEAVGSQDLGGARSVAQVIHSRIATAYGDDLAPATDELGSVPPVGASEEYAQHLAELGAAAEVRRSELGAAAAQEPAGYLVDALGQVPEDALERVEWEHKAGVVEAHREATGWSDEVEPIGPSPGLHSPERRASWHGAWSALGRPESTPEEHELSEGALRNRVAAWDREEAWLPAHVDEEMRVTGEALQHHTQEAALLEAKAEPMEVQAVTTAAVTAQVVAELPAAMRAALVDTLTQQVEAAVETRAQAETEQAMAERLEAAREALEEVAARREEALADSIETKAAAMRAREELSRRGVSVDAEEDRTTAEEWLATHDEAMKAEDPYREITPENAPDEVYDEELDDLVALGPVVEAEQDEVVEVKADTPAVENVEEAEVVEEVPAPEPAAQDERTEEAEQVEEGELVEEDQPQPARAEAAKDDVVDAELVPDEPVVEPAKEPEAEAVEEDAPLPKGVPAEAELEAAVAKAKAVADELADRQSAVAAQQQAEASARAEADQAARAAAEQAEAAARDAAHDAAQQQAAQAQADAAPAMAPDPVG